MIGSFSHVTVCQPCPADSKHQLFPLQAAFSCSPVLGLPWAPWNWSLLQCIASCLLIGWTSQSSNKATSRLAGSSPLHSLSVAWCLPLTGEEMGVEDFIIIPKQCCSVLNKTKNPQIVIFSNILVPMKLRQVNATSLYASIEITVSFIHTQYLSTHNCPKEDICSMYVSFEKHLLFEGIWQLKHYATLYLNAKRIAALQSNIRPFCI